MSVFTERLRSLNSTDTKGRTWLYVPYDQLSADFGPLSQMPPQELAILMVETSWKARRRPYHKQKLALILSNMRHFALEQASRGIHVKYVFSDKPFGQTIAAVASECGTISVMEPAERELRADLKPLIEAGIIKVLPHEGWLTAPEDFLASCGTEPVWRMDAFYRHIRRKSGVLMDDRGKPIGGRFSFDGENRNPWKGEPKAPEMPVFEPDAITSEAIAFVESRFTQHPGRIRPEQLPSTIADAERLWEWAQKECLPTFGPYEDAMSTESRGLFHTRISPLMNIHRILPRRVLQDALRSSAPLASLEGFVRQILGWREYVRHVHRLTDGFRRVSQSAQPTPVADVPGDGGFSRWRGEDFASSSAPHIDGGALANRQDQTLGVPPAFWGTRSGMHCLDEVIESVWDEGYSHHITRLMVLANMGMLLDISPRELTDWFWVAYIDAYDWVVEPNVIGMGMYASDCMTTKPYIAGSGYIRKMSNYCGSCAFDPKTTCPLTPMYWSWLARHGEKVAHLQRMRMPLASLRKRAEAKRAADRAIFETVTETLQQGQVITPEDIRPLLP